MPGRTLPTFTRQEVESHISRESLWVTVGDKVYDVTDFMDDHPGGPEYLLDYAGKDIKEILADESSHFHSEAAYEVLEDSFIGFLVSEKSASGSFPTASESYLKSNGAVTTGTEQGKVEGDALGENGVHPRTGMACEEDLSRETDYAADFKRHQFLDLSRPMFPQIWNGGFSKEFYLDQVHRPRHYKGGKSAPLFGNFLEPLSKTPWWVVPTLWVPAVMYGTSVAYKGLGGGLETSTYWMLGFALWSLIEYIMHRFLFHLDE